MRVYLAGAINGKTDAECMAWRDAASELLRNLGHEARNPMARDFRGVETAHAWDIVRDDFREIDECDAVIARADEPSWGTAMEILYAHQRGLRVVAWGAPDKASPWLQVHAKLVRTVDQAIAHLANQ